eukprot:augustus_masked-scaffold_7-processed-gene-0.42-mRNA-1 protein AED:0.07 eAED:0.11 QI:0/-1/0/1/-1/1/1/0/294
MKLKIGVLQLSPIHGQIKINCKRAEEILKTKIGKRNLNALDILVLPEMAFSGYLFRNKEMIEPLIQEAMEETAKFCSMTAKNYNCYVISGLPRSDEMGNLYNSQYVADKHGDMVSLYDKSHLYEADETWATEGTGFKTISMNFIDVNENLQVLKAGLGICMDINPKGFKAPYEKYELSTFHQDQAVDLLLFSSNWCTHGEEPNSFQTINYWFDRLKPLYSSNSGKKTYFCCADRVGTETNDLLEQGKEGVTPFCGTSCVISLDDDSCSGSNMSELLLGYLNSKDEDLLIVEVDL